MAGGHAVAGGAVGIAARPVAQAVAVRVVGIALCAGRAGFRSEAV